MTSPAMNTTECRRWVAVGSADSTISATVIPCRANPTVRASLNGCGAAVIRLVFTVKPRNDDLEGHGAVIGDAEAIATPGYPTT